MIHTGEKIYQALLAMVEVSLIRQASAVETKSSMPTISWSKELCTIKLSGTRGSGHSHAVRKLVDDVLPNSLIGVANFTYSLTHSHDPRIVQQSKLTSRDHYRGQNMEFDAVILDGTYYLDREKIDNIYQNFAHSVNANFENKKPFFFIFIQ